MSGNSLLQPLLCIFSIFRFRRGRGNHVNKIMEDEVVAGIVSSLKELIDEEEQLIRYSRDILREENGFSVFVDDKIKKLFSLAFVYKNIFQKHDVKTKEEFERLIRKYFRHSDVRDLHDELVDTEEEWDSILKDLDQRMGALSNGKVLSIGDKAPAETELVDARSGQSTTIEQFLSRGKHIVLVLLRHFA